MSDFNTMFDEQMMAQDYSDGSYRILEAMLKRDNLEIQYRKQGYSESQIAQFHEAATAQINEAMSDRWAQAKGVASRGWGKVKAAGKWIWQKIKEMWAKFVAFLKKVWMKIRNLFSKDEDFIKRYKGTILADASIKFYNEHDVKIKLLELGSFADDIKLKINTIDKVNDKDKLEQLVKTFYSFSLATKDVPATKENIQKAINYVESFGKSNRNTLVDFLHANADAKQKEIDKFEKGNMSEEEATKKVALLSAQLKCMRAGTNLAIRFYKKAHSLGKAAVIHLASKVKAVKESTITFMIESATSELDREYAPILEVTDDNQNKSSGDGKKLEYRKWDSGKGAKGKLGVIWDNIKMFFKKMWNWITTKCKAAWAWIKKKWEKVKAWWKGKDTSNKSFSAPFTIEDLKKGTAALKKYTSELMNELYNKSATGSGSEKETADKFRQEIDNAVPELTNMEAKDVKIPFNDYQKFIDAGTEFTNAIDEICGNIDKVLKNTKDTDTWKQNIFKNLQSILIKGKNILLQMFQEMNKELSNQDSDKSKTESTFNLLMSDLILESYELQAMDEADAVDDVIDSAMNNGYGIDDVNHSSLDVLGSASTDPFALDYEKTNTFSQTVDMGDEGTAGWVDSRIGDTTTHVGSGLETLSVTKEAYELNDDFRELDSMLYGYAS